LVSGTSTLSAAASNSPVTLSGPLDLQSNMVTINGAGPVTLSGVVSGVGGRLVKAGSGSLTLSGSNGFTAGVTMSAGNVMVANDDWGRAIE
jgi:autotransporter-associated beta strand protein